MTTQSPHIQKTFFEQGEGDAWYDRNRGKLTLERAETDPVVAALRQFGSHPQSVLEIGASNGWRLAALQQQFGCRAHGFDPSSEAVAAGRECFPDIHLEVGVADSLAVASNSVDVVILGFCLYLCDPEDLFRIASEVDRVCQSPGIVAIYDFITPFPYRNPYSHKPGLYSHKMDFTQMLTWHPAYRLLHRQLQRQSHAPEELETDRVVGVSLLYKDMTAAFPDNPYGASAAIQTKKSGGDRGSIG